MSYALNVVPMASCTLLTAPRMSGLPWNLFVKLATGARVVLVDNARPPLR